jgi:hypothetical protein
LNGLDRIACLRWSGTVCPFVDCAFEIAQFFSDAKLGAFAVLVEPLVKIKRLASLSGQRCAGEGCAEVGDFGVTGGVVGHTASADQPILNVKAVRLDAFFPRLDLLRSIPAG